MDQRLTRFEALCLCVERAGSQEKLAAALGVSQAAVSLWVNRTKQLPGDHVLRAAELYDISPTTLRPDLYPHDLGQRFYGVAFFDHEPELPLGEDRALEVDQRAPNGAGRFVGVDRRARSAAA